MVEDLRHLINLRGHVKARLTRFKTFLDNSAASSPVDLLQERLNNTINTLKEFSDLQDSIDDLVRGTDAAAEHERERDAFETNYYEAITSAKQTIRSRQPRALILNSSRSSTDSPSSSNGSEPHIKLPTISLPQFNGDYSQWVKFRDTFDSLIHSNDNLANIQKFHYLNSALKGDAARLITAYGISDANYISAWQAVKNRYEDKRTLVDHHIRSLYELPTITRESPSLLRQFIDDANNHLLAMKALGEPIDSWDTPIVYLLTTKLDSRTKREWQKHAAKKTVLKSITTLRTFLEEHVTYLEGCVNEQQTPVKPSISTAHSTGRHRAQRTLALITRSGAGCSLCMGDHEISECDNFKSLDAQARYTKAGELRICFNCLKPGHMNLRCRRPTCTKCGKKHHGLLHVDGMTHGPAIRKSTEGDSNQPITSASVSQTYMTSSASVHDCVLLSTAVVKVQDQQGHFHECRVLLDQAAQPNLIKKSFCVKLGLKISPSTQHIRGVGLTDHCVKGETSVSICSNHEDYEITLPCLVMDKITDKIPSSPIPTNSLKIPSEYNLADPNFSTPKDVDLVIGNGELVDLLGSRKIKLGEGLPTLVETRLGWTLGGRLTFNPQRQIRPSCFLITNSDLDHTLRQFWEVEQKFEHAKHTPFPTDPCEQHFAATTTRNSQGRFVVNIPFKGALSSLGSSYKLAEKRFLNLGRKLDRNIELKSEYAKFINEYQALGHLREITAEYVEDSAPKYYLPHHAVQKESTTTKLRVVFDGSAKTDTGVSLNDLQRVGPTVQSDLLEIILRFRTHRYVLSADITKMYRQINVVKEQWPLQRILWRDDKSKKLKTLELTTVTYGTASAPYLATRALRRLGEDIADHHPEASKAIITDFYVDDLLTGGETLAEVRNLKTTITNILKTAGFELRKWGSNDQRVLQGNEHMSSEVSFDADKEPKTLGLLWSTHKDTLRYGVNSYELPRKLTKRILLSEISKIFDPLGLIGPVVVRVKLLIQELWQLKISWDEPLSDSLISEWINLRNSLNQLNSIAVPRLAISMKATKLEIHGFCDASQRAYGACIYLRSSDEAGNHATQLLCAKSRVAPLKTISLPRLELCGALLLAQLVAKVRSSLRINLANEYMWCDSTITLAWIGESPSRWTTFVANRTAEIQQLTKGTWNHVTSENNPADIISRGIDPIKLRDSGLWWYGPPWLQDDAKNWPTSVRPEPCDIPEAKPVLCNLTTKRLDDVIFYKYSTLGKLLRVTSYCERFINGCRKKRTSSATQKITPEEIASAECRLIRLAQYFEFPEEISQLDKGQAISKTSKLIRLSPFIDKTGCIRVGGRLNNSNVSFNEKHPFILPASHILTRLIIRNEHIRLMHAGCQATLASLRARYWPMSARNAVRYVLWRCIPCFRAKPLLQSPKMGALPTDRVTPRRAFYTCGVDYAGPFYIKDRTRSRTTSKAYLCIFVCFATRAVHLELAVDMSAQAFIRCLRRLIARRGRIHTLHFDNGTNFVGARNELSEMIELINSKTFKDQVASFALNESMHWQMIPPHAPHFGGLWEGAVKSAKYHLKRVIGDSQLTYEELYTVLTQVESCMNSRPISPISNDPTDLTPLTPSHFLIGEPLSTLPDPELLEVKENRLIRYQLLQKFLQQFWKRWNHDYLHQLQQRNKWHTTSDANLVIGAMVIVKEDNLPPLQWRIGRIQELHPGKDNITRVVSVKLSNGILKRPLAKICVLPLESDSSDV